MFTGIVEEIGKVQRITQSGEAMRLVLEGKKVLEDVKLGDSIAVSGVCLTVTDYTSSSFSVDVMPETYNSTTLAELKRGSSVNLERAMAANGRFGGHFVTGHVDGTGTILRKEKKDNAVYVDIEVPPSGTVYTMFKGSIAIDGTSLTIFGIKDNVITVSLIPHTYSETVLGLKEPGDKVNIEFDMLAKYIHTLMERKNGQDKNSKVTLELLKENGFM
ncbi:riboflavin synthase [Bacillus methanolicus]|uniref:Riboflavin synthase n=1 Tax=Bacillus methanolicus (strain MGA3 / ATCC 53907) TaxID=796606 RepID=I3E9F8_BACMM|nr:riboflavin synthase [Bacillus methanolicus]AIE60378.1 Riboflavin synthase [Bacillus methanolicus MGA3]EIJ83129.1 riboflavin synthase subunit alpha [Bacillus methanolicus MGA3]